MGAIAELFTRRAGSPDAQTRNTRQSVGSTPAWLIDWFERGNLSTAGQRVTEETALTLTAVYNAITLISRTIAAMPITVYKRTDSGGRSPQPGHPVYRLLHDRPHTWYSPMQWEETALAHTLCGGNGYSLIERPGAGGVPVGMRLLPPNKVQPVFTADGQLRYEYREKPGTEPTVSYSDVDVVHWRGLGSDGIMGWSPIRVCANSLGLSIATQEYGANFFANGARATGALSHPGVLDDPARENIKKSFAESYQGTKNTGRPLLLEEGLTWTPLSIPPDEAQFLQTRQFGIAEIARIYNIQPHKLKDLSKSSFNNIESQNIDFVVDTLTPWLVMIEQELNYKLFTEREQRDGYYVKHNVGALLRGDLATRSAAHATALQNGWMSRDEVRAMEEMNPLGEGGDIYTVQLNLTPVEMLGKQPAKPVPASPAAPGGDPVSPVDEPPTDTPADSRDRVSLAHVPVLADAIAKGLRRQVKAVQHAAKSPEKFDQWLGTWLKEEEERVRRDIGPSLDAWAMATEQTDQDATALDMAIKTAKLQMRNIWVLLTGQHIPDGVAELCSTWTDAYATEIAQSVLIDRR